MRRPPSFRPAVVATLLAGLAAGCREASADERASGAPVAIGIGADVSKPAMLSVRRGVELAVLRLNRERSDTLPPFVVRTVPQGVGTLTATAIATAMRDDATVVGVVGHTDSGSSLETAPIYEDEAHEGASALVAVSPTSTSTALSGRSAWLFRVCPSDEQASRAVARYAADTLGARRAAVVYRADAYGKGWARAFAESFAASGGTLVQRDPHEPGMAEWDAYAAYAAKLRPDVVIFPGSARDAEPYLRALRAAGVNAPLIGGDAVSGLEGRTDVPAGVSYTAFFLARAATSPAAAAFTRDFAARFGTPPDQGAALAYDAAMLVGRATLEVGPNRRAVRDWIASVGRERAAMSGVTGRIAFDARNDVVDKSVVIAGIGR